MYRLFGFVKYNSLTVTAAASNEGLVSPSKDSDEETWWRFIMHPRVRPHVCKLYYAAEWEASILESHPAGTGRDLALTTFHDDLKRIRTQLEGVDRILASSKPPRDMNTSWL